MTFLVSYRPEEKVCVVVMRHSENARESEVFMAGMPFTFLSSCEHLVLLWE